MEEAGKEDIELFLKKILEDKIPRLDGLPVKFFK
jgi:hypothetical protein